MSLDLLLQEIASQPSGGEDPPPVVSLARFFEGNTDPYRSIGCNLLDHPGAPVFHKILAELERSPFVQTVLVEIHEVMPEPEWPFSERIYLICTVEFDQVAAWLEHLQPSEVTEGWAYGPPAAAPTVAPGHRVVAAWWD